MDGQSVASPPRRGFLGKALSPLLISACGARPRVVYLDVSLFNYTDRRVYEVKLNGTNLMSAAPNGFYGENSVLMMQPISLGPQRVSWRLDGPKGTPRNGELVIARNVPLLSTLPERAKWLGLHIYPDDAVEIKVSEEPSKDLQTERGRRIIEIHEATS